MKRTTIMADEETLERLRALATQRGVSFAEVVREALGDKATEFRPRPQSLGAGTSSPSKTAATKDSNRQPPRSWR